MSKPRSEEENKFAVFQAMRSRNVWNILKVSMCWATCLREQRRRCWTWSWERDRKQNKKKIEGGGDLGLAPFKSIEGIVSIGSENSSYEPLMGQLHGLNQRIQTD